jgi:hypothetical protein
MVAQSPGDRYNVAAGNYTVAGMSAVTGTGSATTGGTTNIVKVIQQSDIDSAKQKITAADTTSIKLDLERQLTNKSLFAVNATFNTAPAEATTSANVGDEAANVTVTQKTNYTMYGVAKADLEKVIAAAAAKEIDASKQKIIDYGLDAATFNVNNQTTANALVSMQTTAIAGPELNVDALKEEIAGKKANNAKEVLTAHPGVTDVDVKYSPFWVSSIPKKTSKITLTIQKPTATVNANATP